MEEGKYGLTSYALAISTNNTLQITLKSRLQKEKEKKKENKTKKFSRKRPKRQTHRKDYGLHNKTVHTPARNHRLVRIAVSF